MDKRDIKIDLEVARKLYSSCDPILKGLSLQAFSKEELELPSIKSIIIQLLGKSYLTAVQKTQLEALRDRKGNNISAPKILRILALYYNNGKTRGEKNKAGYFFTKSSKPNISHYPKVLGVDWVIIKHETVDYPGLVYFLRVEDCRKAFGMMKKKGKLDNLYSDL